MIFNPAEVAPKLSTFNFSLSTSFLQAACYHMAISKRRWSVGDLPGSGNDAEFFGGLFAAFGDKPAIGIPIGSATVCRCGTAGERLQRSLSAAGIPVSGKSPVADCQSAADGNGGFWTVPKCGETDWGISSAEHGIGGLGTEPGSE